ncbi:MAG: succinate dehydrogenase cytochrome b subunit [Thermodesulfobacteriota bacterium]
MKVVRRFCGTSVGRKYIMALSGAGLAIFLVVHLLGNTSIFFGAQAFNSYAEHMHGLGPLVSVAEVVLLLFFLVHISFGATLFIRNSLARSSRYEVNRSSGGRTPGSRTMFYSGLMVLVLVIFHLFTVHFANHPGPISALIRSEFASLPVSLFYIVGLAAVGLHLSHGLWSIWQSLGVNHPLYDLTLDRGALLGAVVIAGLFMVFPILGLLWDGFLR